MTDEYQERIVSPEQFAQGYVVQGGHNVPFTKLRTLPDGNIVVREPTRRPFVGQQAPPLRPS